MKTHTDIDTYIDAFEKHRKEYPALDRAATVLSRPAAPLVGRDQEMNDLMLALRNPEKANVALLGEPGSGKTALVQGYAYSDSARGSLTLAIDVERLAADASGDKDAEMANGLLDLVHEATNFSQTYDVIIILFIDEFHRIAMISPSSVEALKPILEKSAHFGFRVIAATTFEEYNEWIAINRALDQRLLRVDLSELPRDVIIAILKSRAEQYNVIDFADENVFGEIYDVSSSILISNSQPRASIDILLNMVGNITKADYMENGKLVREYATPEELDIPSKYALSRPMLNRVIQRAYGIDIDNRADIKKVRHSLSTRILNQDYAVDAVIARLEMSLSGFNDPTRPKISLLSTGPTGSGKALLDTERIPSPDGYIVNGDIRIGDIVYDENGQECSVSGVYPQGDKRVYRVYFEDGRYLDCAGDHLWTFCNAQGPKMWKTDNTLVMKARIEDLNARFGSNVYLSIPNNKAVQRQPLKYDVSPYRFGRHADYIPEEYLIGSINQRWELVRGLFDHYGDINDTNDVVFTCANAKLRSQVQKLLWSLGIINVPSRIVEKELDIIAPNSKKRLFFGDNSNTAKLSDALYTIPDSHDSDFNTLGITRIVDMGYEESMTCIMLDTVSHLYQAGEFHIVTHNTEMAKVITEALGIPLKRFDMSRYMRVEDAAKFGDDLANAAWSAPNAYILIDEAEKSTKECMNILLQVLDDARLTAANNPNRVISFAGNIINLTTNVASDVFQHQQRFSNENEGIDIELIYKALSDAPEFETAVLGRIDVIVPFMALPRKAIASIAKKDLDYNIAIAETNRRRIFVSPDILPYIVVDRTSFDSERGGARDAKRNIKNIVVQELASYMVNATDICPIAIRLGGRPRFLFGDVPDPMSAFVVVEECHPMHVVDGWLNQLSGRLNSRLVNDGLFIPKSVTGNQFLEQVLMLYKQGSRTFKSTFDLDKMLIIDGHDDIDAMNRASHIG